MSEIVSQSNTVRRFIVDSPAGRFPAVDITPGSLVSSHPVVIFPGWSESLGVFEKSSLIIAEAGRRVLTLDHPRWGGKLPLHTGVSSCRIQKSFCHTLPT